MIPARFIALFLISLCIGHPGLAQHPPSRQIDSLEALLPSLQGIQRIKCLNALSEKYWWPPKVIPDSISKWADLALAESLKQNYTHGVTTSYMHLGVSEIYRKNFIRAGYYLHVALTAYEKERDQRGIAWASLWLGQALYSENNFDSAIACFDRSLPYLKDSNDWEGEGKATAWLGFLYAATGNYDSSFKYCDSSLGIREKASDHVCVAAALSNMGRLYMVAGDNDDALDYFEKSLRYAKKYSIDPIATNWNYLDEQVGIVYRLMHHVDSSISYLEYALKLDSSNIITRVSLGETYLTQKRYGEALPIFLEPINRFRSGNDKWDLMRVLHDAAKTLEEENDPKDALAYSREALMIEKIGNIKSAIKNEYELLAIIFKKLDRIDSAFLYLQKFIALNDSLGNTNFLWRLNIYKKQSDYTSKNNQITFLDRENRLKEENLQRETFAKWVLAASCVILLALGYFLYRNLTLNRKNEKLAFVQKTTELEMKVLRAQMNPHFIFNSLNSINKFILESERLKASGYLGKFSKLMRMILQNSQAALIPMEAEFQSLELYLELEALRFNHHFDYKISISPDMEIGSLKIPPLLLQPYAENAIWHGLMQKSERGKLDIEVSQDGNHAYIKICDDGIGRAKSSKMRTTSDVLHKSMGHKITAERIALFERLSGDGSSVKILDLVDGNGDPAGTEVTIKIPLIYD